MSNKATFRVYWEDTDAGGVVYYANYLKFAERARTELLRSKGINQTELAEKENMVFVVRHAEMDLIKAAKLDDELVVETLVKNTSGASMEMEQKIARGKENIALVRIKIACVTRSFKPTKIPAYIKEKLCQADF